MYIGLDIGTSGSKADLIDRNGNVLGSGHVSYSFSKTTGGYRELVQKLYGRQRSSVCMMLQQESLWKV